MISDVQKSEIETLNRQLKAKMEEEKAAQNNQLLAQTTSAFDFKQEFLNKKNQALVSQRDSSSTSLASYSCDRSSLFCAEHKICSSGVNE